MGEHEHGVVVRRLVAPPSVPLVAAPRAPDRAEHVAPHDGGADSGVAPDDELVVDTSVAAVDPVHFTAGVGGERPLVQARAAHTERVVDALVGTGHVAVE